MKVPLSCFLIQKRCSKKIWGMGQKQFMGREYMGVNRSTFLVNEKGKIFRVFEKVKPAGHAQEVLELLKISLWFPTSWQCTAFGFFISGAT